MNSEDCIIIPTEQLNPRTMAIDVLSTLDMLQLINAEDAHVIQAVQACLPQVAIVIDVTVERIQKQKGRLFYIGAGTSGRLAVLDASECPPTFGVTPDLVQGIIAGGDYALRHAIEGAEDSAEAGKTDILHAGVNAKDVVIGLSASGGAPYVIHALQTARHLGAFTGGITCNTQAKLLAVVDVAMVADVGPEVIAGSTRLKAGTAQKLILNMLSTGTMIKLGKTYQNWMVDVKPSNVKLRQRAIHIVCKLGQVDEIQAKTLLAITKDKVKLAVLMGRKNIGLEEAKALLTKQSGHLRLALSH
jgi:N-acetylmuramic acid 6-phosphate etherase